MTEGERPGRRATKADLARFLGALSRSRRSLLKRNEHTLKEVTGLPHADQVFEQAQKEGFLYWQGSRAGQEIHLLLAGEKFLRNWRWRRWRWFGLIGGGLAVAAESIVSLVLQLLDATQRAPPP